MGADHGATATQDPRGLRILLRQYPPQEGARVNHDIAAGERGELKGSRRVREGVRGNGAPPPPRLWPTSTTRAFDATTSPAPGRWPSGFTATAGAGAPAGRFRFSASYVQSHSSAYRTTS